MPSTTSRREPLLTWAFLRLCLCAFAAFIAAFQLFPTIPFHLIELGAGRAGAGRFLTVYTWASALSAPLTGALADRFGRRRMLLLAAASFALCSVVYGVVRSIPWLLAVACVHGFFWSGMLASTGALIADVIPVSRRTEGIGYYGMAATAAVAVAPAIGLAVYHFGWLVLMLELAGLALLLLLMAARLREGGTPAAETTDASTPGEAKMAAPPRLREALSWRVVVSTAALFLVALPYGGITSYAALFAAERAITPRSLFFTVFALTVLVTRLVLPPLVDRGTRPERLLLSSFLLVPPGLVLLARAEGRGGLVLAAVVFAAGFGSAYPSFMTWVLARTDPRHRAATFGSVLFAFDTAVGGGSLLVGELGDAFGLDRAFLVLAAVSALAVPTFLLTRRLLPARAGAGAEGEASAPPDQR